MLLATWNINGIRARAVRLAEWLAERQPDVICLQELKVNEAELPALELRAAGYEVVACGQAAWNGVAVLARERPEVIARELPGAPPDAGARFLATRVLGLEVVSLYVPNGKAVSHPDYLVKLAWLESLARYVEGRADADAPLIVGGDFNVCRTDLDSYGGARLEGYCHHTPRERELVGRLEGAGLVDLFRARHPEEPGFSWWDYRAGAFHKKEGMRLDLLLATPGVAARVKEIYVDREFRKKGKPSGAIPSDHAPVVALLED